MLNLVLQPWELCNVAWALQGPPRASRVCEHRLRLRASGSEVLWLQRGEFWAVTPQPPLPRPVSTVTCGQFCVGLTLLLQLYSNPFLPAFLGFALNLNSRKGRTNED